jgi:hypothetical protein
VAGLLSDLRVPLHHQPRRYQRPQRARIGFMSALCQRTFTLLGVCQLVDRLLAGAESVLKKAGTGLVALSLPKRACVGSRPDRPSNGWNRAVSSKRKHMR